MQGSKGRNEGRLQGSKKRMQGRRINRRKQGCNKGRKDGLKGAIKRERKEGFLEIRSFFCFHFVVFYPNLTKC